VCDPVWDAAEDPALHSLLADDQEIGSTLLGKPDEHVAGMALVDERAAVQALAPQSGRHGGEDLLHADGRVGRPVELNRVDPRPADVAVESASALRSTTLASNRRAISTAISTAFAAVSEPSTPTAIVETMTIDRIPSSPAPQAPGLKRPAFDARSRIRVTGLSALESCRGVT
jgi:hypothetical protein